MQSGVCLTYLIFVPQNFSTALLRLTGIYVAPEWFLVVMVAIQVPLSWIRDIRKLTVTNFLANALILYGLITCLALSLKTALTTSFDGTPLEEAAQNSPLGLVADRMAHLTPFAQGWFLFIGTSVSMACLLVTVVDENARAKFMYRINRSGRYFCLRVPSLCWCLCRKLSCPRRTESDSQMSIEKRSSQSSCSTFSFP